MDISSSYTRILLINFLVYFTTCCCGLCHIAHGVQQAFLMELLLPAVRVNQNSEAVGHKTKTVSWRMIKTRSELQSLMWVRRYGRLLITVSYTVQCKYKNINCSHFNIPSHL